MLGLTSLVLSGLRAHLLCITLAYTGSKNCDAVPFPILTLSRSSAWVQRLQLAAIFIMAEPQRAQAEHLRFSRHWQALKAKRNTAVTMTPRGQSLSCSIAPHSKSSGEELHHCDAWGNRAGRQIEINDRSSSLKESVEISPSSKHHCRSHRDRNAVVSSANS